MLPDKDSERLVNSRLTEVSTLPPSAPPLMLVELQPVSSEFSVNLGEDRPNRYKRVCPIGRSFKAEKSVSGPCGTSWCDSVLRIK